MLNDYEELFLELYDEENIKAVKELLNYYYFNNAFDYFSRVRDDQIEDGKIKVKLPNHYNTRIRVFEIHQKVLNPEFLPDEVDAPVDLFNFNDSLVGIGKSYLTKCAEIEIGYLIKSHILGLALVNCYSIEINFNAHNIIEFINEKNDGEIIKKLKKLQEIINEEINEKPYEERDVTLFQEKLLMCKEFDLSEYAQL